MLFSLSVFSFYLLNRNEAGDILSTREIKLQFITYNDHGNNLYLDNVMTGIQTDYDITVTSIFNVKYDTSYSTKLSGTDTISPVVTVANIGRLSVPPSDSISVYLELNGGAYFESQIISSLNAGQSTTVTFPVMTYNIGEPLYFRAYAEMNLDSVRTNDTLKQYSIFLPGYKRNVMYEEFTSNSSPACANNNQDLNAFINTNFENVCAIKYHLGEILLDSFYLANPAQNNQRADYYFIYSVPHTLMDGTKKVTIPYGDSLNLYVPFFNRLAAGTPVSISVTDERINGDSIRTSVTTNVISSVKNGNYKLRLAAVERYIQAQGANGETNFYDVFRRAYPDSNGISISMENGTHIYNYSYHRENSWTDSMLYTVAFIQNEDTKEILNCAKGRNVTYQKQSQIWKEAGRETDIVKRNPGYNNTNVLTNPIDSVQTKLNIEMFEAYFPPIGWKVFNRDGNITFEQYSGANGPTFGGTKSVIMDFFDYNATGQRDSMSTKIFTGLLNTDTLRFDYAYAQYGILYIDSLIVKISTDGGLTFPTEIFRRGGFNLRTAPQTTSFFIPQNSTQWRTFKYSLSNVVNINNFGTNIPNKFILHQNYPNPFNPSTKIKYELPYSDFVIVVIYDVTGREVKTLVSENQNAGIHEITFDGFNFASGVYFYKIYTQGFSDTKRMVLLK